MIKLSVPASSLRFLTLHEFVCLLALYPTTWHGYCDLVCLAVLRKTTFDVDGLSTSWYKNVWLLHIQSTIKRLDFWHLHASSLGIGLPMWQNFRSEDGAGSGLVAGLCGQIDPQTQAVRLPGTNLWHISARRLILRVDPFQQAGGSITQSFPLPVISKLKPFDL